VIRTILFYVGFLLIIILFSEEFARAGPWLRAFVRRYPRYRIVIYPLLLALIVIAGLIMANSLINFVTDTAFSYD
jgi:hypothetical protein